MVRVTEGCEVQAGVGEEAFEEGGPVLHPFQPGLHQSGQLGKVALAMLARDRFRWDQTSSTGLSSWA